MKKFFEIPDRIHITGDQIKGQSLINLAIDRLNTLRMGLSIQQGTEFDLTATREVGEAPAWKVTRHEVAFNTLKLDDGSTIKTSINYGLARIDINAVEDNLEEQEKEENLKCFCSLVFTSGRFTKTATWQHDEVADCMRRFDAKLCAKHCKLVYPAAQTTTSDHADYDVDGGDKDTFLFLLVSPTDGILNGEYNAGDDETPADVTGCCAQFLNQVDKDILQNEGGHLNVIAMALPIIVWKEKQVFEEVKCKCI